MIKDFIQKEERDLEFLMQDSAYLTMGSQTVKVAFKSFIRLHDKRLLEMVREEVGKEMEVKCLCHMASGSYFVCCHICENSIPCNRNQGLSDLESTLTKMIDEI